MVSVVDIIQRFCFMVSVVVFYVSFFNGFRRRRKRFFLFICLMVSVVAGSVSFFMVPVVGCFMVSVVAGKHCLWFPSLDF